MCVYMCCVMLYYISNVQPSNMSQSHESQQVEPEQLMVKIETYGCQMNVSDTEIVQSILKKSGMGFTTDTEEADVLLLNTCAIRENAETKIWDKLKSYRYLKKKSVYRKKRRPVAPVVGVLGCMAERLKTQILETDKTVDVVVGPDAYRDLPRLLSIASGGESAINTQLSLEETYADVTPVRLASNQVSAFVSIMRGCDNMCSYCIVPFTRGRERSRCPDSIVEEVRLLTNQGFREITLLGQNVNSYNFLPEGRKVGQLAPTREAHSKGFTNISRRPNVKVGFTELLKRVAEVHPEIRVRFTSPHPKDFPEDLITLMKENPNVCSQIHLPLQSGWCLFNIYYSYIYMRFLLFDFKLLYALGSDMNIYMYVYVYRFYCSLGKNEERI